jgi:hypothetical protein
MQLNRFDLNLLIALDALRRKKNVTHELRDYFGDQLLVRVGREPSRCRFRPRSNRA